MYIGHCHLCMEGLFSWSSTYKFNYLLYNYTYIIAYFTVFMDPNMYGSDVNHNKLKNIFLLSTSWLKKVIVKILNAGQWTVPLFTTLSAVVSNLKNVEKLWNYRVTQKGWDCKDDLHLFKFEGSKVELTILPWIQSHFKW